MNGLCLEDDDFLLIAVINFRGTLDAEDSYVGAKGDAGRGVQRALHRVHILAVELKLRLVKFMSLLE